MSLYCLILSFLVAVSRGLLRKITHAFDLLFSVGTFSSLKVEMNLSRSVGFYFLQVFVPSVLLVFLSWLSFWVDPNAVPARVSLGVTCILTMTTQSSGIRQSLPPVSYVKAIDVWMCVCLMFVFAALLEFAYVNVIMRRPSKMSQVFVSSIYSSPIRLHCICICHLFSTPVLNCLPNFPR